MKVRFDGLDVMAMVSHLQVNALMLGRRVVNVYDDNDRGDQSGGGDTYIFKFDGGSGGVSSAAATAGNAEDNSNNSASSKAFLTLQSGIRFHDTPHHAAEASCMPTPFCSKLRKHLRGLRLQKIQQIGFLDRVVIFTFMGGAASSSATASGTGGASSGSSSSNKCFLILELYAKGNLILTDQDYKILALLRSHAYQDKKAKSADGAVAESPSNGDNIGNDDNNNTPKNSISKANKNKPDEKDKSNTVAVQVGQIYPVTYAATMDARKPNESQDIDKRSDNFIEWVTQQLEKQQEDQQQQPSANGGGGNKKKKSPSSSSSYLTLKTLLLRPGWGYSQYGPALLEHCILVAGLVPHQAIAKGIDSYTHEQWKHLEDTLAAETPRILKQLQQTTTTAIAGTQQQQHHAGYLLYLPRKTTSNDDPEKDSIKQPEQQQMNHDDYHLFQPAHADKILQEFQPILLKQHESRQYITCRDFGQAVSQFFGQLQSQKNMLKAQAAEEAARQRLEKVRNDQATRVATLQREQVQLQQAAALVQAHAAQVDQALTVINSALHAGFDWDQLEQLVQVEREQNQNPIAQLIQELQLDEDAMILRLPLNEYDDINDSDDDDDNENGDYNNEDKKYLDVQVFLHESAHANASRLFAKYRASKEKSQKTIEASSMALKAAEETAQRQLLEAQKKKGGGGGGAGGAAALMGRRRLAWYEKFHWFITTENYLVLAGKDAHQNELLVKRYLRPGDAYLHADVFGAASCILRSKRRRVVVKGRHTNDTIGGSGGSTEPVPLSDQALREAGTFTICHSSAWSSRMVTSAWWVESHQVSKTAPSGEYLTVGSFMVRGKKNFLPPSQLELGLAVLFRLGDNEGILRHANERRDFALSELEEEGLDDTDDVVVDQTAKNTKKIAAGKHTDMDQSPLTIESVDNPDAPEKVASSAKAKLIENAGSVADAQVESRAQDEEISREESGDDIAQNLPAVENEESPETIGATNENVEFKPENKKRGYSVRERKLIKKYGSLEEAEKALGDASKEATLSISKPSTNSSAPTTDSGSSMKRGKKSKMKRAMKKYVDQDEDDRELALLLLQGGEKSKNDKDATKTEDPSQAQQLAAAETAAVLVKDSSEVAKRLSDDVRSLLAQCVQVGNSSKDEVNGEQQREQPQVRWEKLDADILEQLIALEPHEAQVAAATRLLTLRNFTRVDNFSSSLAGILRTIGKYGYESLNKKNDSTGEMPDKAKRKGDAEKEAESSEWKEVLAEEGIPEGDLDDDAVDDTFDLKKLTGKPLPEDLLLYAVPVLAPYQTVSQYRYRVKLTPGSIKRGKAAKQCLEMLIKGDRTPGAGEECRGLIKKVIDNDWVQTIISDVKISAQGASKLNKNQNGRSGGKKK